VCGTPGALEEIQNAWPLVYGSLKSAGQGSRNSCAGAIATIAIETANRWLPVRELYNDPPGQVAYFEHMYGMRADLGNNQPGDGARFYGRGYIQITGRANYRTYGQRIGVNLESTPDLALDPGIAAAVFASYWESRNIQEQADREDWVSVRRSVQGGSAGLGRLIQIAEALLQREAAFTPRRPGP
jgi:hypothetical protein